MKRDLGMQDAQVHHSAEAVLAFWFDEVSRDKWFGGDAELDAEIERRFAGLLDEVIANPTPWEQDARATLAAIILIDQFSRNIHRGDARAFAADPLARRLATQAIDRGWDQALDEDERRFLYMPFMHSEAPEDQRRSIELFTALGDANSLNFAERHAEQIDRFGRFPQRNEALGRPESDEERAFLSQPGVRF